MPLRYMTLPPQATLRPRLRQMARSLEPLQVPGRLIRPAQESIDRGRRQSFAKGGPEAMSVGKYYVLNVINQLL
jgi:hypothetical protein